jgi:prepilin-type N-terminal cleavage/methylation domain-containing protein
MDNNLAVKSGFTLLELTIVLVIIGILLVAIISNGTNFINRAKFQATVREMGSIAQAAIDYYSSSSSDPNMLTWPASLSSLAPIYMPQPLTLSPLGARYLLSFGNNSVTVTTTIPNGILIDPTEGSFLNIMPMPTGQQISITQSIPNEFSGRLDYDLQYLYKE